MGAISFPQQTVQKITKAQWGSHLYWQYNDDDNLQAFVASFNSMSQEYLDWFNQISLPVYAGNNNLTGALLEWVLTGLYGIPRYPLPSTMSGTKGAYATLDYATFEYAGYEAAEVTQAFATTDDTYKRIATWNLYKGDGHTFSIRWLKRRIQRFLTGVDGVDGAGAAGLGNGVDQTNNISVTFSSVAPKTVNITVNETAVTNPQWPILKAAIRSGACQLPFQFTWNLV